MPLTLSLIASVVAVPMENPAQPPASVFYSIFITSKHGSPYENYSGKVLTVWVDSLLF